MIQEPLKTPRKRSRLETEAARSNLRQLVQTATSSRNPKRRRCALVRLEALDRAGLLREREPKTEPTMAEAMARAELEAQWERDQARVRARREARESNDGKR